MSLSEWTRGVRTPPIHALATARYKQSDLNSPCARTLIEPSAMTKVTVTVDVQFDVAKTMFYMFLIVIALAS